jgi:hypothetical protein
MVTIGERNKRECSQPGLIEAAAREEKGLNLVIDTCTPKL